MQILIRNYKDDVYVWKTAKYHSGSFVVENEPMKMSNVVAIVNDNRKNYIQCSCCGKVFRRGDRRFEEHKAKAKTVEVCFDCPNVCVEGIATGKRKFIQNADGTYTEKRDTTVRLTCSSVGLWTYPDVNSEKAKNSCKRRMCDTATEKEIDDFFTRNPSVFDDVITVDRLIEDGYNVCVRNYDTDISIAYEEDYTIYAIINRLGIVDRFEVWVDGESSIVFYSKKYGKLFYDHHGEYREFYSYYLGENGTEELKTHIAKLYR